VRDARSLHVESPQSAWLCLGASAAAASRLALRLGLVAAQRAAAAQQPLVCIGFEPIDRAVAGDSDSQAQSRRSAARRALSALRTLPPAATAPGRITVRTPAWSFDLPLAAARLLTIA
jgi:hypothetical protein